MSIHLSCIDSIITHVYLHVSITIKFIIIINKINKKYKFAKYYKMYNKYLQKLNYK